MACHGCHAIKYFRAACQVVIAQGGVYLARRTASVEGGSKAAAELD
jgi:hypothetical protein